MTTLLKRQPILEESMNHLIATVRDLGRTGIEVGKSAVDATEQSAEDLSDAMTRLRRAGADLGDAAVTTAAELGHAARGAGAVQLNEAARALDRIAQQLSPSPRWWRLR